METISNYTLQPEEAAIWWLGQAGYVIRAGGLTLVIDPYLSNSAAEFAPEFARNYPPPLKAKDLHADIFMVTHDHLDHLDPDTIANYVFKDSTWFVAPRLAARKLSSLGIPHERLVVLNAAEDWSMPGLEIRGIFALPTGTDVLDTTGFLIRFSNGRSVYHTSDTQYHPIVLAAAPQSPELLLVPINGKWGNPGPEQAAELACAVQPEYAIPNHYDMMRLNSEQPESFKWFCEHHRTPIKCEILEVMQPFIWKI